MRAAAPRLVASLAILVLAAGCGGGGGGDSSVTATLPPSGHTVSSITSDGQTGVAFGPVVCGDIESFFFDPVFGFPMVVGVGERGFASFDLDSIPADATVVSATLTLLQYVVTGTPYALGDVLVDHAAYGPTLDGGAYAGAGPADGIAVLSADAVLGPKSCDVTSAVQDDLVAGRAYTQYRFRFPLQENYDGDVDSAHFYSAASAPTPADAPRLVVTYRK